MRLGRTLPPAASPISIKDILIGLRSISQGQKEIRNFESQLKEYYCVKHCFLLSSGKAALTIILKALHDLNPEKNEVLIPAYTCYSVPSAIVKAGLKVKLCDINPQTLDFDLDKLKNIVQTNCSENGRNSILSIIPTHLFGLPADVEKVRQISTGCQVSIIEDAAQAMGGTSKGRKFGTLGDVGFFSLGRGKAFSTVEGGIILTNNRIIADSIKKRMKSIPPYTIGEIGRLFVSSIILNVFLRPSFFWFPKGIPFLRLGETLYEPKFKIKKISSFQAGLARNWQKKLKKMISVRNKNIDFWNTFFIKNLSISSNFRATSTFLTAKKSLIRWPVIIERNKVLDQKIKIGDQLGLGIMRSYPNSINNIDQLKSQFEGLNFPAATYVAKQLFTLPVHNFVSRSDRLKILALFNK